MGTKRRFMAIEWLNSLFLGLNIPVDSSEEELRLQLFDGTILCGIMNKQDPVAIVNQRGAYMSSEQRREKVERFLSAVEEMGVPQFSATDLEHGPISAVVDCLLSLRDHLSSIDGGSDINGTAQFGNHPNKSRISVEGESDANQSSRAQNGKSSPLFEEDKKKHFSGSRFQLVLQNAVTSDQSAASLQHAGHKFHEVFQLKQGRFSDIPAAKLSEIMRSNGLDNAPTQSLLSVVNCILDESIERKNGEIPLRVGCLLRKVFQEVERRVSTQAEHIRKQNNLIKAREEKYQSRIKVLQTLAAGTNEETQIVLNQLELIKEQKATAEENKKHEEHLALKLAKDNENNDRKISELTRELETMKSSYEHQCQQVEAEAKHNEARFQERIKEIELMLSEAHKRINELESLSEAKFQNWNMKESFLHNFISFKLQSLKGLKISHESIKVEFAASQRKWREEINGMGIKLKVLVDAAENYHTVLAENRKLYNEVQELKGNIRVYCRIRPFLPGQNAKSTTVDYIGENGEIVLVNPSKQGKDGSRMFKFNKVFGQAATQVQVFLDIQPLIRSVLDGYNVCIFAYGQTGSGKTYTMGGPNSPLEEEWGVNYRALNDLFHISQVRRNAFTYEVGVQMIEIYNEQIRDLLSNNHSHKRLGVLSSSQPHGLAVPDANMVPVKSTADVLELMQVGFANRAVGSTALNERSSRSHSILTVHVRGVDLKNGSTSRGSLHLIDLAGSERVDRSEVVGDRLKEAQHINKSLSALGDVIFALSQKNAHVPYRNSKLTQVLQSSLGGQAKALMLVHVNPDVESYLETLSTLKFAERVSGVELGAARSNKEGKDIKGLIEQVASLKDTIARKDEEIEQLQMLKDPRTQSPKGNLVKHDFSSAGVSSLGEMTQQGGGNVLKFNEKDVTDPENLLDCSDMELDASSLSAGDSFHADEEHMGSCDADFEGRLSDVSGGDISIGEDSEYSVASNNDSEATTEKISRAPSRIAKPLSQQTGYLSTRSKSSDSLKSSVAKKSTLTSGPASYLKQVKR